MKEESSSLFKQYTCKLRPNTSYTFLYFSVNIAKDEHWFRFQSKRILLSTTRIQTKKETSLYNVCISCDVKIIGTCISFINYFKHMHEEDLLEQRM